MRSVECSLVPEAWGACRWLAAGRCSHRRWATSEWREIDNRRLTTGHRWCQNSRRRRPRAQSPPAPPPSCQRGSRCGRPTGTPSRQLHWNQLTMNDKSRTQRGRSFATGWLRSTAVERRSLAGEPSLSCARPVADGWPLMWVNRPLWVNQPGQLSLSSLRGW